MKKPETIGFLLSLSVPGSTWRMDLSEEQLNCHPFVQLRRTLDKFYISYKSCDTLPGWYNLNHDWLQLYVPLRAMTQEYRIGFASDWWPEELRDYLDKGLEDGRLIMMVSYVELRKNFPRKTKPCFQEEVDKILQMLNTPEHYYLFKKYNLKFLDWV